MSTASSTLRLILLGEDKSASKAVKGVGDETEKSSKKMQTFHKVGTAAGVALAGGLVLAGKAAFDMTKRAAEDQQAASRMAQTFHTAAHATSAQVAATEAWITAQGKSKGFSDDELRPSLSKLVTATHDVGKAQKLASLAMDISTGTGKSLESVSFALAKAQNGNVTGLARLGIQTSKTGKDTMALEKANTAAKQAQLNYTAAVKDHGKHSAEASIASDKLRQANENVGAASEKTKKTTLDLDTITKNLADTYGGAASKNAETAAGKQKIMTVQYHELQEQIGAGLLPVMSTLLGIGLKIVSWISKNTTLVGVLVGVFGGLALAVWAITAATAAWNAVLALNPLGLVVVALVGLAIGLAIAYKKVGWFRDSVNAAFHGIMAVVSFLKDHWEVALIAMTGGLGVAVVLIVKNFSKVQAGVRVLGAAATWLWNNAFQPALSFIVKGIAVLIDIWGHMLSALGHLPGFGWAKDAGAALQNAADHARSLADNINKIPKKTEVSVITTFSSHRTGNKPLPGFANGVRNFRGGLAVVGERGPEVVGLPRGSNVYPHGTGPGGGGNVYVTVNASGLVDPNTMARKIQQSLLGLRRSNGGGKLGLA